MFVCVKPVGRYRCLQIAQNYREAREVKQKIVSALGRVDEPTAWGQFDTLTTSPARFGEPLAVLSLHEQGALESRADVSIGSALVFERLWRELRRPEVIQRVASARKFGFDVEQAVLRTVLTVTRRPAQVQRGDHALVAHPSGLIVHFYGGAPPPVLRRRRLRP